MTLPRIMETQNTHTMERFVQMRAHKDREVYEVRSRAEKEENRTADLLLQGLAASARERGSSLPTETAEGRANKQENETDDTTSGTARRENETQVSHSLSQDETLSDLD
jgi:hypothetical protein